MKRQNGAGNLMLSNDGWWYVRYRTKEVRDGKLVTVQKGKRLVKAEGEFRSKTSLALRDALTAFMATVHGTTANAGEQPEMYYFTLERFVETVYFPWMSGTPAAPKDWDGTPLKSRRKLTTQTGYASRWKQHIKPVLGSKRVIDITTQDVQAMIEGLSANLSRGFVTNIVRITSAIFKHARRVGILGATMINPCVGVEIPRWFKKNRKREGYTLEEIQRLLATLGGSPRGEQARAAVALGAFMGLRRSEIQGLRWSDYDGKRIYVHWRIVDGHGDEVKTEASEKGLTVCAPLKRILDEYRQGATCEWMFATWTGKSLDIKHLFEDYMAPVFERLGIEWTNRGWHGFRHFLATNLAKLGVRDHVIQELMRHANVRTTRETYIHSSDAEATAAADKFGEMLGGSSRVQ